MTTSNPLSVLEERQLEEPASASLLLAERQAEMSRFFLEVQRLKEHGGGAGSAPSTAVPRYQTSSYSSGCEEGGGVQRYHATAARTTIQMGGISMAPGAVATDAVKAAMDRHRRQRQVQHKSHQRGMGISSSSADKKNAQSTSSSIFATPRHQPPAATKDRPLTYPADIGGSISRRAALMASIGRLAVGVLCLYLLMTGAWYFRSHMSW